MLPISQNFNAENLKSVLLNKGIDLALNGIPKKTFLISTAAMTSLAALYLTQPEELTSQAVTVLCATGGAWLGTEAMYAGAKKIKAMAIDGVFKSMMKDLPPVSKKEKKDIEDLLNSILNQLDQDPLENEKEEQVAESDESVKAFNELKKIFSDLAVQEEALLNQISQLKNEKEELSKKEQ